MGDKSDNGPGRVGSRLLFPQQQDKHYEEIIIDGGGAPRHGLLLFYEARTPCDKMDRVAPGLRALMADGRQGVLAEVLRPGRIRVGDALRLVKPGG